VLASQNKQRYYLKIFEKTGICNGDSGLWCGNYIFKLIFNEIND
jgi:hypothetical protein